jgi:ribosomal protein L29
MRELLIKWRSLDVVKLQEELKEVHLLKNIRRNIAKILCVLTEKGATKG